MGVASRVCSKCGEKNNPSFASCWNCHINFETGFPAIVPLPQENSAERKLFGTIMLWATGVFVLGIFTIIGLDRLTPPIMDKGGFFVESLWGRFLLNYIARGIIFIVCLIPAYWISLDFLRPKKRSYWKIGFCILIFLVFFFLVAFFWEITGAIFGKTVTI
jgi:hypothetical protein